MGPAITIAIKDLALRMRDRSVFIVGLIAPLALAFIFNLVFGGAFGADELSLDVGVVVEDEGAAGEGLLGALRDMDSSGTLALTEFTSLSEAEEQVEEGTVGAVIHVPAGFSDAVAVNADTAVEVIGNVDAPTTTDIAAAIAREFAAGVRRTNLAVTTALSTGAVPPGDVAATIGDAASAAPLLGVGDIETESRQLNTATYFVAGLSIFFLFFIAGLGVTSMLEERREGTLFRLMAAPIRRRSIVLGKSLTSVVIGLVSMIVLVIASGIIMGAEWGPPLGVAMMVTSAVLAVVGVMTLVGGFAKTPEQAGNLQSIVAVTFGMLGGTFVPVAEGEGLMSSLRFVTPNGWFMRGLGDIASGDAMAALPSMGILLAMAAVTGGLGLALVRKVVHA